MDQENKKKSNKRNREEKQKIMVKDLLLKITGLGGLDISREDLLAIMEKNGFLVGYVDFSRGLPKAYIRLEEKIV